MPSIAQAEPEYDVLIIGAGLSGICSLYHVRKRFPTWRIKVIDNAPDVGGTWYWNQYPGCRFDSESISYCFSFDKELLDEWHWTEAFSPQPETQKYIRRVAEKHDMYKDIQFNTQIKTAHWNDSDHTWTFVDAESKQYTTRFFLSCLGILSTPTLPAIPGVHDFKGQAFHTTRWPSDLDIRRDFKDKRIGIIGTGATGIQIITAISQQSEFKSLSVFQRTPNWSVPLRNFDITPEQMDIYRTEYDAVFKTCAETPTCLIHQADPRKSLEVSDEERLALWEKMYNAPGSGKWVGVFRDTYTDREANKLYSNYIADKIRKRVNDPEIAQSLIPTNHGFGTRRVPLESGYFEAYNQPNVHLVDLQKTPITTIVADGIETSEGKKHDLDVLIYATGFDAITGAFSAIEWHGNDNRPLLGSSDSKEGKRAIWPDHKAFTFLGITVPAMPNMFMTLGPHQPVGNATRSIEHAVGVIGDLLQYCKDNNYTRVEPSMKAVDAWTEHVYACSTGGLMSEVDSWMTGVNTNVKGKTKRTAHPTRYTGHAVEYRRRCEECKTSGYTGLVFA
ncbi:hypothetical protein ACN47E_007447 [Coniothyrium glycines]